MLQWLLSDKDERQLELADAIQAGCPLQWPQYILKVIGILTKSSMHTPLAPAALRQAQQHAMRAVQED